MPPTYLYSRPRSFQLLLDSSNPPIVGTIIQLSTEYKISGVTDQQNRIFLTLAPMTPRYPKPNGSLIYVLRDPSGKLRRLRLAEATDNYGPRVTVGPLIHIPRPHGCQHLARPYII